MVKKYYHPNTNAHICAYKCATCLEADKIFHQLR